MIDITILARLYCIDLEWGVPKHVRVENLIGGEVLVPALNAFCKLQEDRELERPRSHGRPPHYFEVTVEGDIHPTYPHSIAYCLEVQAAMWLTHALRHLPHEIVIPKPANALECEWLQAAPALLHPVSVKKQVQYHYEKIKIPSEKP